MKVKSISAGVKFSKQLKNGCWKTVELSAEASIHPSIVDWKEEQKELYDSLCEQLKLLWGNNHTSGISK